MVERATRRVLRIAVSRAAALLAMLPVLLALPTGAMADRERHIRARITPPSKAVLREILTSHLDILHAHGVRLDVRVSEAELSTLRGMGCSIEIVDQDVYESALRGGGFLPQYISYSEAVARLNAYAATYPAIAQVTDIGNSVQNRDIFALKISDNVGVDENEPEVLYVGNHHAREVITPILTLAIADSLLTNYGDDPQFTQWVDEREIWVVPTINPDGLVWVELNDLWWRKNRRTNGGGSIGVDLNRNYAFQWGHDNIGSSPFGSDETFRGSGPASEPEIQAVVGLVNSRQFVFSHSYHSYGNWWLWGNSWKPSYTVDEDIFAGYGALVASLNGYEPGNPATGTIYLTNGSSDDWLYGAPAHPKIFAMTPEVGGDFDGFHPSAARIPVLVAENMPTAWLALQYADRPGRLAPPGPPTFNAIPPSGNGDYTVTWNTPTVADTQPVVYELVEKTGPATVTDGFESGTGNLNTDGWVTSGVRKFAGSFSLFGGNADRLDRVCLMKEGRVVQPGDNFTFRAWYNTESGYDYLYAVLSTDGGRSFVPLAGTNTSMVDPNGRNADNGITGSSGGAFIPMTFSLAAYVGQTVWLGVRYNTDEGTTNEGVYVDEMGLVPTYATSTILSSTIATTSFPITGKPNGTYWYVVRGQDAEGVWGYVSAPTSAVVNAATTIANIATSSQLVLDSGRPTPFSRSTAIHFSLPTAGVHSLIVYDVTGRQIRTLSHGELPAGPAEVSWDGRNEDGIPVPSGVYFYRLTAPGGRLERRTVLLR